MWLARDAKKVRGQQILAIRGIEARRARHKEELRLLGVVMEARGRTPLVRWSAAAKRRLFGGG